MKQKLKSNKGITILHALVSIMLLTIISSIIFSSAMANIHSYAYQLDYQQTYLTVSSAANLFIDSLEDDVLIFTCYEPTSGGKYCPTVKKTDVEYGSHYLNRGIVNPLYKDSYMWFYEVFNTSRSKTGTELEEYFKLFDSEYDKSGGNAKTYTYTMSVTNSDDNLQDVVVEVTIRGWIAYANFYLKGVKASENYYLQASIPLKGYEENDAYSERTVVNAVVNGNPLNGQSTLKTFYIQFDTANIVLSKGRSSVVTK